MQRRRRPRDPRRNGSPRRVGASASRAEGIFSAPLRGNLSEHRGSIRMKVKAAVAHKAGAPLEIDTVDLDGPRQGEVLVEIKATGVCHTDAYTLSGKDPEGLFPAILGHEGAGVVVDVGPGVRSLRKGDHVIPLYTPECRECAYCTSGKTNMGTAIRETKGRGVMLD